MLTILVRFNGRSLYYQMGKQLGEMADEVFDGTFLWSDVILRRIYVLLLFDIVLSVQVETLRLLLHLIVR